MPRSIEEILRTLTFPSAASRALYNRDAQDILAAQTGWVNCVRQVAPVTQWLNSYYALWVHCQLFFRAH